MTNSKQPIILYVLIALLVIAAAIGPIYNAFSDDNQEDDTHEHAFDYNDVSDMGNDEIEIIYRYLLNCGICQEIASDVDDFEDENDGETPFHRVHVSHEENLPQGLESGVPTVLVVEDGEIVDEIRGAEMIIEFFDDVLDGSYSTD